MQTAHEKARGTSRCFQADLAWANARPQYNQKTQAAGADFFTAGALCTFLCVDFLAALCTGVATLATGTAATGAAGAAGACAKADPIAKVVAAMAAINLFMLVSCGLSVKALYVIH